MDKTEKTLLKIEKTLKENDLPEDQKAELVQAKTELEAQSRKLREQLQIEANVPRDEIAAIVAKKLVITRMEIVQLKKGTDLIATQKEERRELEAKRSVVAIEELGLSFLNSQNTHRLVDALADSANVDIASGVDRSKKEQLAQEFAGLLGVKVENLYPNYGKDLHFSSPDPRRENGQDISRNEFFLNKLSSALKMSPSDLLGADLNYNALTDAIKGKTTQSKTDSSLASIY